MDITLARTFLAVAEAGSFVEAARTLNVTQSTVSTRIRSLEEELGYVMFERSKAGAELTIADQQFRRHAISLVRIWQHAQRDIGLYDKHRNHLTVGALPGLWDGFLMKWIAWLRQSVPDIAVTASAQMPNVLSQRMQEGALDLAVLYRAVQSPGLVIEHLFDEEFVQVSGPKPAARRGPGDYVFLNWGPEFELDHAASFPRLKGAGLNLDLGAISIDYLIANGVRGYVPMRLARRHISRGRLVEAKRERRFIYPVYMVYPEVRDEAFEPILAGLRRHANRLAAELAR